MKEIELKIESEEIFAKDRKLKAVWSMEAKIDLQIMIKGFDDQLCRDAISKKYEPITDPNHVAGVQKILRKYPWLKCSQT